MTDIIAEAGKLADLGTKGLLLVFLVVIWKDKKEMEKKKDDNDNFKSRIIQEMYNDNIEVIKENTQQAMALKSAIEKNSIVLENNTHIQESLTEKIYQVLARK